MNKIWLIRGAMAALMLGVLLAQAPNAVAAEKGWLVSFEEAKAAAAKEKKTIFMEFTGSDWCPPCKALAKNVLTQDAFKTEAPKQFILLKLDNPRDKSKQTDAEKAQYPKLAAQYKVTGVPTIILADEQGRPFAKMVGYRAPGEGNAAEAYVKTLTEKNKIRVTRDKAFAKAADAEGVAKAKFLDQAISVIDTELAVSVYADTVKEIIGLDADNSAGLKAKYEGIQQSTVVKAEIAKIRRSSQGAGAAATIKAFDDLITKYKPSGETLQEILFAKSFAHFQAKQMVEAKGLLLQAKKLAPKSRVGGQIDGIIARYFTDKPGEATPKKGEATPKKDEATPKK
ncbi:MAG: thioredoxin family protein [Pirellulaceae bacterium]|nr:thioredoxin family protein [Pirellulaceae bacterium]